MGRRNVIASERTLLSRTGSLRQPKRNQRRTVPNHIIGTARLQFPAVLLPPLRKPGLLQPFFQIVNYMEYAGTILNEFQESPV